MGFGSAKEIGLKLSEAKDKAIDALRLLVKGTDPREHRDDEKRRIQMGLWCARRWIVRSAAVIVAALAACAAWMSVVTSTRNGFELQLSAGSFPIHNSPDSAPRLRHSSRSVRTTRLTHLGNMAARYYRSEVMTFVKPSEPLQQQPALPTDAKLLMNHAVAE